MTLQVGLHSPVRAHVYEFVSRGETHGAVSFITAERHEVTIYTTPRIARELAAAFDDAKAADEADAEQAWEDAHDPEVIAGRAAHTARLLKEAGR